MNQLSKTRINNLYRKTSNLINRYQRKGLGFIRYNRKTLVSLDYSNECPKEKEGNPCPYCYKADLYKTYGKTGFECGNLYQKGPVDLKLLDKFCKEFKRLIKYYDRPDFSVRLFSFGDITEDKLIFWTEVLTVFCNNNIKVHAITKQFELIQVLERFLTTINLSTDNLGTTDIEHAKQLRERKPDKYIIRSVLLNEEDENTALHHDVDIVTAYHGGRRDGLKLYRKNHKTYGELLHKLDAGLFKDKMCCAFNGKCVNCMRCQ
jgi:hypothetical protein